MKYRKKPVVIDAIVWDGYNFEEIKEFAGHFVKIELMLPEQVKVLVVDTLESNSSVKTRHAATIGDYIIKGIKGEFYFCKPDIFHLTYDPA